MISVAQMCGSLAIGYHVFRDRSPLCFGAVCMGASVQVHLWVRLLTLSHLRVVGRVPARNLDPRELSLTSSTTTTFNGNGK